jgi:3-methyladenine DNA glycosylase/8-oxoguanine DNA glycosylase
VSTVPPGTADSTTTWLLDGPLDLVRTCRPMVEGGSDPTWAIAGDRVRRGLTTPEGPAALDVRLGGRRLSATAVGPGAGWVLARARRLLGLDDDPAGFEPGLHPVVQHLAARQQGTRMGASLRIWDAVVPVVLGQRVTVAEARRSWRQLVRRYGSPAPGHPDVLVPPTPSVVARLAVHDWHVMGVERGRAEAIRRLIPVVPALERAGQHSSAEFQRAIMTVPGVGPWTATALASSVLGDPDAVLLGDLHLPSTVSWALAREPRGDDARMLELLEPWRGHRGRVVRLIRSAGRSAPRRGPRYTPLPIHRW